MHGISQNPDTKDYIMIFNNNYCEECGKKYTFIFGTEYKWCNSCYKLKNFTNWTSENKKIDDFIRETQLKFNKDEDIVFEWIPYNQFMNIKEVGKDNETTLYSAIWKDGPLYFDSPKWVRDSDKTVNLKC